MKPKTVVKTLYQTMIEATDEYGAKFTYSRGAVTGSKTTAISRIKAGMKGYVQDINSKNIIYQNLIVR